MSTQSTDLLGMLPLGPSVLKAIELLDPSHTSYVFFGECVIG